MSIVPDSKDWTWVLERPCPECGFDTRTVGREEIAPLLRDLGTRWRELLETHQHVGVRPAPDVWSPLEYGCHVRDAFLLFDKRLGWMLGQDNPLFENWDQDATAVADRYDQQDPRRVATELRAAADGLAGRFDTVTGAMWARPGRRSDGAVFTVETFGRYLTHDPMHHLWDVTAK